MKKLGLFDCYLEALIDSSLIDSFIFFRQTAIFVMTETEMYCLVSYK